MSYIYDPDDRELKILQHLLSWQGKRVVEFGCGDGRLTERLAEIGARIDAYDPDEEEIIVARENLGAKFASQVRYHVGKAEEVKGPIASYDIALFSWSL